jgi:hypothetical protein
VTRRPGRATIVADVKHTGKAAAPPKRVRTRRSLRTPDVSRTMSQLAHVVIDLAAIAENSIATAGDDAGAQDARAWGEDIRDALLAFGASLDRRGLSDVQRVLAAHRPVESPGPLFEALCEGMTHWLLLPVNDDEGVRRVIDLPLEKKAAKLVEHLFAATSKRQAWAVFPKLARVADAAREDLAQALWTPAILRVLTQPDAHAPTPNHVHPGGFASTAGGTWPLGTAAVDHRPRARKLLLECARAGGHPRPSSLFAAEQKRTTRAKRAPKPGR